MLITGLGTAHYWFTRDGTWLPIVVPLLFQLPFALLSALLWRYLYTQKERHRIREAFGYFLPSRVVDELVQDVRGMPTTGQLVNGICLATDAEQYTALSESMHPSQLRSVLNDYYKILFEPVGRRGGFVSDVVGDEMLAIWTTTAPDRNLRAEACLAALDIVEAVNDFNRRTQKVRLPTRVGLHSGEMLLGNVGAEHHYEYRAIGDIVNAATRIQSLNKQLGTRILASREVIQDLGSVVTREIGAFRLVGKSRPLVIHELMCQRERFDPAMRKLHEQFAAALLAFRQQHWQDATDSFTELLSRNGKDGPALFYLSLCQRYAQTPPAPLWDGVVTLSQK
jgi:adenylate cyclase